MKSSKISVIVTYFNCENTISNCVNSILNQSFNDIEIICINSGSTDNSEKIVLELADKSEKIKLISLPNNDDIEFAKQTGLGIASSEFVLFVDGNEILETDFIRDKFFELTKTKIKNIKNNYLYRRSFLENDTEVVSIIQNELNLKLEESEKKINVQKAEIKEEFNKFYQNNVETIKNNSYEVLCRFNQLEKLFYEKDYGYREQINNFIQNSITEIKAPNKEIYDAITKVYEYINSEIEKKRTEIDRVYEEITRNYHYTEEIVEKKYNEQNDNVLKNKDDVLNKISELEKEIVVRYVNLKRVIDIQLDEIESKVGVSGSVNTTEVISMEKIVSENVDKIYSRLNETSTIFYEELSKIYKDLNEGLRKKSEEDKYFFEQKINDLRNEFDIKLQNFKNEIVG